MCQPTETPLLHGPPSCQVGEILPVPSVTFSIVKGSMSATANLNKAGFVSLHTRHTSSQLPPAPGKEDGGTTKGWLISRMLLQVG